jgi:hypothetical protein
MVKQIKKYKGVGGKRKKNMLEGKGKKRKSQKEHKTRALVCDTPVKKRPIPHRGKKSPNKNTTRCKL